MRRRFLIGGGLTSLVGGAALLALYLTNATPIVPRIERGDLDGRPLVVKLHAQWCPVCRITKSVWADIEAAYSARVHLLVLDFTNETTSRASRIDAERLGLTSLIDEYAGTTGYVIVADGVTGEILHEIKGSRDRADYQRAIDGALARAALR